MQNLGDKTLNNSHMNMAVWGYGVCIKPFKIQGSQKWYDILKKEQTD